MNAPVCIPLCMRGNIYTEQKCTICNGKMRHNPSIRAVVCSEHPEQKADGRFIVLFGRSVRKRFEEYRLAERFLDGLRYEVDRGTFDSRDYKHSNPLRFGNLADQWIEHKKHEVKKGSFKNISSCIKRAKKEWEDKNIKSIGYAELEDFFQSLPLTNKTKSNYRSILHTFWSWLRKRRILKTDQIPEFPEISFELAFRKTIDKETQQAILEELRQISSKENIKIWLGIKFLSTYISIRPVELINIQEKHIDTKNGFLIIPHPKEKRPKIVPLTDEDIEILNGFPVGLPDLYFFRHKTGKGGVQAGTKFGDRYLYKWWKRACKNLGIEGVDMYGGTRHSSALAMTEFATPEQIKSATMHTTNRAFERYYQVSKSELKDLYSQASQENTLGIRKKGNQKT